MSYYISVFLSTELTCFPRIIDSFIGKYYSNAVGNALTWVLVLWLAVHYVFNSYLNILFKQMHYKSFIRTRLLNGLWFCGFYGTSFLYCLGTIIRNNTSIGSYCQNLVLDGGPIPVHIIMGLGLIGTFFFQSLVWEVLKNGFDKNCLTYLALTFLPLMTYYSRRTELFLSLLALVSVVHFLYNALRCLSCTMDRKNSVHLKGMLFLTMGLCFLLHVVVIPIFLIIPLVYNLRHGLNIAVVWLSINLTFWWISEVFSNPLYRHIEHWVKHANINNPRVCPSNILECSLFPIRDDFSYNMSIEKHEIKQREQKSIQRRKPKDRGVFVQTLKCMVAIRRKLNKKRSSESSEDSDSDDKDRSCDDGNEADSSEDDSSSSEEEDNDAGRMKRQYQEETAKALLEDKAEETEHRDADQLICEVKEASGGEEGRGLITSVENNPPEAKKND